MSEFRRGTWSLLVATVRLSWEADRRSTLTTFVAFGARPSIGVLIAWLISRVIDAAVMGDRGALTMGAIGIAAVAGLAAGTTSYTSEVATRMIERTSALLDLRQMELMRGLPDIADLEDPEVLDQLEALRQQRVHLSEGADAIALMIGAGVRAAITLALLATVSPWMLFVPVLALPTLYASRRAERLRGEALETVAADARLGQHLYQVGASVAAATELRVFGIGEHLRGRYVDVARRADDRVVQVLRRTLAGTAGSGLLFALGYLGALVVVVGQFSGGEVSLGETVLMVGMVTLINIQVLEGVAFHAFLRQTLSAMARLLWLSDRVSGAATRTGSADGRPVESLRDGITLTGVGFRYPGAEAWALREVDLHLPAGCRVALVGVNGAGKSTLIKLLCGLYRPTEGVVAIDGHDLSDWDAADWQRRISVCFQDATPFEFTAGTSVGVGDLSHHDDAGRVSEAVTLGAADEVVRGLPAGLATPLGRSLADGVELSGGQWQRVALARARMRSDPLLLALDEATAAIDPLAEEEILTRQLAAARDAARARNGITVFASHRLALTASADLVVVLDANRVVQVGTHDELMCQPGGRYRELYETQARAYS